MKRYTDCDRFIMRSLPMQDLPHRYSVTARAAREGDAFVEAERLPRLASAPPTEFGGPGDRWSPETLLAAAVADCFVLTFRAIADATSLPWVDIRCDVEGTLDRVGRVTRFTDMLLRAYLRIPAGASADQAHRVLTRAKERCLVSNSLISPSCLEVVVEVAADGERVSAA
jgi:organic hydroperoxide reductase OsmC/OhrA